MTSHALRTIRPHRTRYRRRLEALRRNQQLDPMQSSDERRFWSHPAPERREYEVHYHLPHPRRLVTMGEMVGASLFIGFVLFIATAIVAWLVWQVLA